MDRISSGVDEEANEYWTSLLSKGSAKLRGPQGKSLETVSKFGGGFGSIGVGHGKTIIALLAGTAAGASNPVVFVPPALVNQMNKDMQLWSNEFRFIKPTIVSYGILSTRTDLIDELNPDMIIADEAHYLRNVKSTRTDRFLRYMKENPTCGLLVLSGTITSKSLLDYSHLLVASLRDRAPIPLSRYELERWAACIDPDGEPTRSDINRLGYLVLWSKQVNLTLNTKSTIRAAFKERLTTTPGVISTTSGSCDSSLYMVSHVPEHSSSVKKAIKQLTNAWTLPNNEPIADASAKSRVYKNLSLGFYYEWDWGSSGVDLEWLEAKRNLNRLIGRVLKYSSREGRDSPKLVMEWSRSGKGNKELQEAVALWDQIKDRANPIPKPIWICKEKIDYLVDWAKSNKKCIVWYTSKALETELSNRGLKIYGAGSESPQGDTCAASIAVHGKGKNLQAYDLSFIAEPPANGATFEQLLGRTHRAGQESDSVWWHYFNFGNSVAKAKSHSEYIEETQGIVQKLNIATFLTTPKG